MAKLANVASVGKEIGMGEVVSRLRTADVKLVKTVEAVIATQSDWPALPRRNVHSALV